MYFRYALLLETADARQSAWTATLFIHVRSVNQRSPPYDDCKMAPIVDWANGQKTATKADLHQEPRVRRFTLLVEVQCRTATRVLDCDDRLWPPTLATDTDR
ncbi:hypothetical protein CHH28_08125 [Bacterioplanes sanyensis]|uniref:Uncharacterized protein n=1 Tax=Bacterioplanes sanyensis TaxID=1249553 RepID=A0A222FHV8_9GAMM|nr:hypothetical protein [Bacterioplanes sanyensis]ASP38645.1 hypothetical protein CHH28_08125 [Bacterioplanes sanyensis]